MKNMFIFLLCFSSTLFASELEGYKNTCGELGFTPKTEKFGECVLKLRSLDKNKFNSSEKTSKKPTKYEIEIERDWQLELAREKAQLADKYREIDERQADKFREREIQNQERQLELQRNALEEQERANKAAEHQRAYDALINYANGQKQQQAERNRAAQEQMNRAQQQTWDANQKKIENDWKGY